MICCQFHHPSQVFIVGIKLSDFVEILWFILVALIVSSIYSLSDLFAFFVLIYIFQVLCWILEWYWGSHIKGWLRSKHLICWSGLFDAKLEFEYIIMEEWIWWQDSHIVSKRINYYRVIPEMVVGFYPSFNTPIFWITHTFKHS